jgi:glycosyltransferase involved in cell wall biosynthesis
MMAATGFKGRLAIQQRVLPPYRATFFDELAPLCERGLSIFAGEPRPGESIASGTLKTARFVPAHNLHLLGGQVYLCWQAGLGAWLAGWDPDALILEANPRYLATPSAARWMKHRDRPVLGWGLGASLLSGPMSALRRRFRLSFLRQFDVLLTYSQRGAEEYAALGFKNGQIFVAPNAAVSRPSWPMPSRPPRFDGRPSILFVGRLQARKRVDLLLQACAALPENLQPQLVIVGDGAERTALENLARTVYPSAEFPGAKHGADLATYFSSADLFVLPGTGGLAVQEAMSYGLPIIMGVGDGTNEDLVRENNGWHLAEVGSLPTVLRSALSDVSRLRRMGAESYRIVKEEINLEKMVEVFISALNQLVA